MTSMNEDCCNRIILYLLYHLNMCHEVIKKCDREKWHLDC